MKKRTLLTFLAVCMLVVVGGLWFSRTPDDPVYKGKPLSQWLRETTDTVSPNSESAKALRALNTKAIPWLLWTLENGTNTQPSPLENILDWVSDKLGLSTGLGLTIRRTTPAIDPQLEQYLARWALFLIGQKDERVIRLAKERLKEQEGWDGGQFLAREGDEYWEDLLQRSEQGSSTERINSLVALALDATSPEISEAKRNARLEKAIPSILRGLRDPDPMVRDAAIVSFAITPESPVRLQFHVQAVPILIELLSSPDPSVQAQTAYALESIGPNASPSVPKLISLLEDPQLLARTSAAKALGKVDKIGQHSKEALLKMANSSPEIECRAAAATALWEFGIKASVIDELIGSLESPDLSVRADAAKRLMRIGPGAAEAMPKLLKTLPDSSSDAETYVAIVSEFEGFGRDVAIPYLIKALSDSDPKMRHSAATILTSQYHEENNSDIETALLKAESDSDKEVRDAAKRALQARRDEGL